jgi:hypothetical protein
MPVDRIPDTPYGDIPPHWNEWLDKVPSLDIVARRDAEKPLRPRLYQPAGDNESVIERIGRADGLRESLERAAMAIIDSEPPSEASNCLPREARSLASSAEACANWWQVGRDERAARRAVELGEFVLAAPIWVADEHLPLTIDLLVASVVGSLGRVVDRVSDCCPTSSLVEGVIDRGITPFLDICDARSEWWTRVVHNWRSVICGQIGIAAISVHESLPPEVLERVLRHAIIGMLSVLDEGDEDGGWFEGVSYWRYGIGEAVEFIDVLHRATNGDIDLFTHPYLKKAGDFALYQTWPDGRVFHWGDCGEVVNATMLMARMARAANNPDWQSYVRRFPAEPSLDTLFWEDDTLVPSRDEELPLVKRFRGNETAVLRSGWGDDDLILGIKAGETTANHSHLDIGSFVLVSGGVSLVDDGGHWPYGHSLGFFDLGARRWDFPGLATECHSTILVDGVGQSYGPEHRGVIVAARDFGTWAYATVDATDAYPQLTNFVRYFLLIRPDTVVVVDDLSAPDRRRFGWRAVLPHPVERTGVGSTGEQTDCPPTWVTAPADGGPSLSIRWLAPTPDEGLMAEHTHMDAVYPSTYGLAEPSCSTLTLSPLIRSREQQMAVAMRIGHGEPIVPDVTVAEAYRSMRITAGTENGPMTWSIMWGEACVAALS